MANLIFPITSSEILLQCIPQRSPIVMVDQLITYSADSLLAGLNVPESGIFIKKGELQEPGLIEHMAQSVALHTGYGFFLRDQKAPVGYIGSISKLQIDLLPLAGQTLRTEVKILQEFAGITLVDIISKVDGKPVAKGQMKTVIAE